jgi:hypothetical protein
MISPDDLAWGDLSRFDSLLQQRGTDSIGVVNLWALRSVPIGDPSDGPPSPTTLALGVGACLGLVKALDRVRARLRTPPRLWIVTRGSQAGGTEKTLPNVAQSPLWGLGRTVALEYPEMWGGLIDLPTNTDAQVAGELLFGELKAWGTEDQILLRDGRRLAARLLPVQPEVLSVRPGLRNDASYWIVGGLGGVGLSVFVTAFFGLVGTTAAGMLALGFFFSFIMIPSQTLLQQETPPDMLGRVSSSLMSLLAFAQVIAMMGAGPVAQSAGIRNLFFGSAVMLVGIGVIGLWSLRGGKQQAKADAAANR